MAAGCDKGRIAFANETNSTALGKKAGSSQLNGDLIKKFASGGDVISARLLHKNPSDHVFVATMFLCMNSIPDCSRPDAFKNCWVFDMPYVFDDTQKGSQAYRKPDDTLKSWITTTPGVCEAFVELLTEHWGSKLERPDFCDPTPHISQASAMYVLVSKFTKSEGGDDDKVPCSVVQHYFKHTDKSNVVSLGKWLKKTWGIEKKTIRVSDPDSPGSTRQIAHYVGLRLKENSDDGDIDTECLMD